MRRLKTSLEEVYDVFAIRIILNTPSAQEEALCWKVHNILTKRYNTLPKKFRDWLTSPRDNGYQALHVTLMDKVPPWVEVQIRTKRMDEIAEKGSAAHWKYKKSDQNTNLLASIDPWLTRIRTSLDKYPQLIKEAWKVESSDKAT